MHFNKFRDEHFEGKIKNNTPNFFRLIPSDESRKELSVEIDNLNDHRLLGTMFGDNENGEVEANFVDINIENRI